MTDHWIEPRARIPFVGIIAMVFIVGVVAIFVKTQLSPLFPSSTVTVQGSPTGNVIASPSASFYGERQVVLKPEPYLQGSLTLGSGTMTFMVDPAQSLLTIIGGGQREEIQLQNNNGKLNANFEYSSIQTSVSIDPSAKFLTYNQLGKSIDAIDVPLSDAITYQGYFTVRNQQYLFQFYPGQSDALVTASVTDQVSLTNTAGEYSGVWDEAGKEHPVTVDTSKMLTTISDVY